MRKPAWIPRLVQITEALERSDVASFRRAEVEAIFGISRSGAKTLILVAGGKAHGNELIVSRESLLDYLRHSPAAQDAMQELGRRKRLAHTLAKATEDLRLHSVKLPVTPADQWTLLRDLTSISLQPGELRVVYNDAYDLMAQLYRLAVAAGNEWDAFVRACSASREGAA